jgi:hypothetical protein
MWERFSSVMATFGRLKEEEEAVMLWRWMDMINGQVNAGAKRRVPLVCHSERSCHIVSASTFSCIPERVSCSPLSCPISALPTPFSWRESSATPRWLRWEVPASPKRPAQADKAATVTMKAACRHVKLHLCSLGAVAEFDHSIEPRERRRSAFTTAECTDSLQRALSTAEYAQM